MADRLKGITLEIGGDTQNLSKSLKNVNSDIRNTQSQLKDVQKLLKLDPTNTELLRQKQQLFKAAVSETKEKLDALKKAQETMDANGVDKNSEQYMALQREIISTQNELDRLEEAAARSNVALEKIGATADKVAQGASKIADSTRALSAAAGAGLVAIGGAAYSTVTLADDLNTMAKQTGFTTAELQKMKYASDLVDVSMEDIITSSVKLKKNMASESDSVVSAFSQLGVSTHTANGELRDSTTVYWEVVEALSHVTNETERDTLAMTILGKGADSLAGIIDDGGTALRAYGDDAERLGLILSQDTLDGLNQVNDKIDETKAKAQATLAVAGAKAVEALLPVIDQIVAMLANVLLWIGSLDSSQIRMLVTILAVVAAISPIASIVAGIANAVSALIPVIMAMNTALAANPYLILAVAIVAAVGLIAYAIISNFDAIKAAFQGLLEWIQSGFQSLCAFLEQVDYALGAALIAVINGLFGAVKGLLNAGISIVESFVNAVLGMLNALIGAINSVVGAVAGLFGGSFGGFKKFSAVNLPKLAKGGEVLSGTALVGEAGPELLTVSGGRAVVTPLTATVDGGSIARVIGSQQIKTDVGISFQGSLSQLAAVLQPVIVAETKRIGPSFTK